MSEYHVASFIVRTQQENLVTVIDSCNQIHGCEVHGHDGQAKIIVTLEAANHKEIANLSDQLAAVKQVIDISPVYHEYIDESENEDASAA
ncbi:chaperone NapD [Catenovulum maritimum]|uniref:chaperone NapD n=1 Tax=Catenovulum maritimum TaxID=1513271 RepID=UPI0006604A6F|nr:chaperone NapD [Catenovulum maritimum]